MFRFCCCGIIRLWWFHIAPLVTKYILLLVFTYLFFQLLWLVSVLVLQTAVVCNCVYVVSGGSEEVWLQQGYSGAWG